MPNDGQSRITVIRQYALMATVLTGIVVVGILLNSSLRRNEPAPAVPRNFGQLDPQLRAYLREKLEWLRKEPRAANRRATLATVYAANGLWPEARVEFAAAARLDPGEPLAWMYVGVAELETGNLAGAIRQFREVVRRFPEFPQGHYRLADALLRSGSLDEAEVAYHRLIELMPLEWRGLAGLGDIHLRRGKFVEAAKWLEQAVKLGPGERIAHYQLGLAYQGLGQSEDAAIQFALGRGAVHFPMPDAWSETAFHHMKLLPDQFDQAAMYIEAGQASKAVALLEAALEYHPEHPGIIARLAGACHQAGFPERARKLLSTVLQARPDDVPALIEMALSSVTLGLAEEALKPAERAVSVAPQVAQTHLAKANVLLALERDTEAVQALESALRCDPSNAGIQMEIGDVLLRNLSRPEEALARYKSATAMNPGFTPAYIRLADLQIQRAQKDDARATLEVLRKLPANPQELAELERKFQALTN